MIVLLRPNVKDCTREEDARLKAVATVAAKTHWNDPKETLKTCIDQRVLKEAIA